jgi:hypothetical protein
MSKRSHAAALALGCLGGLIGGSLRSALEPRAALAAPPPKQVTAEAFVLVDANGKTTAQLDHSAVGSPCLTFFDSSGHQRLQAGLYADGVPYLGLVDAKTGAVGLFRVAGSQGSPVLVLKAGGRDRMIIGLGMNDPAQEPFIEYFDAKGEKHELLERK